jgi:hypothetical protein
MTNGPKKRGRPPFLWHGPEGDKFVTAVMATWFKRRSISKADAIRSVVKRPEFAHLGKYNIRYLEKRLLDAREFWNPFGRALKEWRKANRIKIRSVRSARTASQVFPLLTAPQKGISGTENELVEQKVKP